MPIKQIYICLYYSLQSLTQLQVLDLSGNHLLKKVPGIIGKITTLVELNMEECGITAGRCEGLVSFPLASECVCCYYLVTMPVALIISSDMLNFEKVIFYRE